MLLQDEQYTYDRVGNPVEIRDWRDPGEWQAGAKPVTRKMQYDDLYRLKRVEYQYTGGADDWKDPYAAEVLDNERPQPSPRADFTAGGERVRWQTYAYDWLGNTSATGDDRQAFYDRSLGTVGNEGYQLASAGIDQGSRAGSLTTDYDEAGNLVGLTVGRSGKCTPAEACPSDYLKQHFEYRWDEVGRLVRARRWDMQNPDAVPPDDGSGFDAELSFTYDASDQRVRKTSGDRHTLYFFASLELRNAGFGGDYELGPETEVPYLFASGVRLARVVYTDAPALGEASARVFLELGDHLGSTSVVLDLETGELVQRSTAYAYGAPESSYRPGRWGEFREDYRFTGKEDDVEVGLIYFGKRYYAPLLQRWISPDPLAIHAPGEADLNLYAYVHGKVLVAVDPVGLADGKPKTPGQLADAYWAKNMAERHAVFAEATRRAARISWLQGDAQHINHQKFVEFVKQINRAKGNPTHLFLSPSSTDRLAWANSQKNPIVGRFLARYQENTGQTYHLTKNEAANLGALISVTRSGDQPNIAFRGHLLDLLKTAKGNKSGEASRKVAFTGLSDSYMAGGLGQFTVFYEGTLSVHKGGQRKFRNSDC